MYAGHTRAFWAVDATEPPWVASTFADLALTSFDGAKLTGEVTLVISSPGLDPRACAVEVVWDDRQKLGVRVEAPPGVKGAAPEPRFATWRFAADIGPPRAFARALAFVFCPIDDAHRDPPWGAHFDSIEMFAAGPNARDAYCHAAPRGEHPAVGEIEGHRDYEVGLACGVLARLRSGAIVDECSGEPLLSLDALGAGAFATLPEAGAPIDDGELRRFADGSRECRRVHLGRTTPFGPEANVAMRAFVARADWRVTMAFSREGMREP